MKVFVADIINSGLAIFHEEGTRVYDELYKAWSNHEEIEVSFERLERCSTQFLNASIGNLYLKFDPVLVDKLISYNYGNLVVLKDKIAEVRDNAIHSKDYNDLVENA